MKWKEKRKGKERKEYTGGNNCLMRHTFSSVFWIKEIFIHTKEMKEGKEKKRREKKEKTTNYLVRQWVIVEEMNGNISFLFIGLKKKYQ
jgi:hypothetical protein